MESPAIQPSKPAKQPVQRKSSMKAPVIQAAVIARRSIGQSKKKIANELGIAQNTVTSIIGLNSIEDHVEAGRLSIAGLIPKSVNVIDYRLDKNSETAAFKVLEGIGVLRSKSDVNINIAAVTSNSWYVRKRVNAGDSSADRKIIDVTSSSSNDPSASE
jgi:hypothetical protein